MFKQGKVNKKNIFEKFFSRKQFVGIWVIMEHEIFVPLQLKTTLNGAKELSQGHGSKINSILFCSVSLFFNNISVSSNCPCFWFDFLHLGQP